MRPKPSRFIVGKDLMVKGLKVSCGGTYLKWAGLTRVQLQSGQSQLLFNILLHSFLCNAGQLVETSPE